MKLLLAAAVLALSTQAVADSYDEMAMQNQLQMIESQRMYDQMVQEQQNDEIQRRQWEISRQQSKILKQLDQIQSDQRNGCNGWIGDGKPGMPDC